MQLSLAERLILINQYRILQLLDPSDENVRHCIEAIHILESGYEKLYGTLDAAIDSDTLSNKDADLVERVMQLYWVMQQTLDQVSGITQQEVNEAIFPGFDGNYETKLMAYARFYWQFDGGRFQGIRTEDNFNSHRPMRDRYERQLARWESLPDKTSLTKEQIQDILTIR